MLAVAVAIASFAGCSTKTLDPTQIGRFRPTPAVNVILDSLGVAEEPAVAWEDAGEPRPDDIRAVKTDYVLQPGDIVRVSIFELLQEGVALINDYVVTETGKLSIPEVGVVQASGLTEAQLEEEIRKTLSPNILRDPSVTVTLLTSQQRAFSILGNGVPSPGRYFIPRYDYRLMDALATAQVQMQFNISHVYVSRREGAEADGPIEPQGLGRVSELETIRPNAAQGRQLPTVVAPPRDIPEPCEPARKFETEREMLDLIAPQAMGVWPRSTKVIGVQGQAQTPRSPQNDDISASMLAGGFRLLVPSKSQGSPKVLPRDVVQSPAEFGTAYAASARAPGPEPGGRERMEWIFEGGQWKQVPARSAPAVQAPAPSGPARPGDGTEWVLRNGNWVQTPRGQSPSAQPSPAQPPAVGQSRRLPPPDSVAPPTDLGWDQAIQTRAIRIPADRLLAGDPRYNIVIKPGDTIHVPVDLIGEFYIMGNVNRTGTINLTGRPMTSKMAIAAAGGLGPLAYPKRVEVIRRIGTKREEIVMVDLDKIASGEQPDFFIKPNDLINVGTDITSRWRAILRNAFRATYGFGFVYDRNFADADFGKGFQLPHWL